ncbi:MAG: tetratricopeptide repeat protein [Deltaproteobacteria bacterium]|nr:tetratricopeptide repeat protein [Myxococcales bacterium]MDP3220509.1 tetratricopeptide repeat protein [Deltaproteobacteria bacterium]
MRRLTLVTLLLGVLVPQGAWAQPSRGRVPSTASVHPFSTPVEAASAARALLRDGRPSDAVALLDRQRLAWRRTPELVAARAVARFQLLAPPLEPASARTLSPAVQRELAAMEPVLARHGTAHPDDAAALLTLGRLRMVLGSLDSAASAFEATGAADPRDPAAWNDLAMVLVALHRLPEAERALSRATERSGRDPEPWNNLGAVRLARGDARAAVEAFQRACELGPATARYRSDLGAAQLAAGSPRDAIASFEAAAAASPGDPVVLGNLGYALSLTDRLDEAVATLRRAAAMPGRTATIEDNLGLVLLRRGDRAGAREAFQRAVALAPDDPRARAHLASLTEP